MLGFELSEDQFYVLLAFGYRPARMPADELDAAIKDVVAFARAELERSAVHGYRQSDLPYPEDVLAAFHQKFLPAPDEVLEALAERPLSRLSADQARERLYEEISRARRELARAGAMARGAGGGEVPLHPPLPLQRSPVRGWRRVALEPARGAARDRPGYWLWKPPPGWENEGPWGGSLAWLEEQRRPEAEEPCDRCNWPGRYPELVGLDDGGDPKRILARAKGGSTGARRLLQQGNRPREDLLEGLDWIDHMRATGDRRCALCGGLGYAVPLKRDRYVRLRRSRAKGAGPDDQIVGRLLEGFDERGRLRPQWDRSPQASAGWEVEPAVGEDTEFGWGAEALHLLRDEQALVHRIVAATVIYRARGRTLVEGERVDAHKRDYEETPATLEPLALRQVPRGRELHWRRAHW
jgi:hypothetical protein